MKRIIWLLILALLLCGCGEPAPEETTSSATAAATTTEVTEPAGIYVPASELEAGTDGAVRYFLPEADSYGIRMMGDDLLVFSGTETTTLTRYTGEQLYAVAGIGLDCRLDPADTSFQISGNGITYYHPEDRAVVFLDNDLKEVSRLKMSDDMVGKPILSANRMYVYYCTAEAVRVYDTTTGLNRLLKTISYEKQSVEDVLMNDTVLRCFLMDSRGQAYTIFISTQTGELLAQIYTDIEVASCDDRFYAKVPDGIQELLVFGNREGEAQVLTPADPFARSWFLKKSNGLVAALVSGESTRLDYYDLASGLHTGSVELPGEITPEAAESRDDGTVLMMAYDSAADAPVILSWQKDATPEADETVYTGPRYTADDPDVVGLDACAIRAKDMGELYGLRILIGPDAAATQPWDYTLEMEYQTTVIHRQLDALEKTLAHFPEGFFEDLYGQTTVCIVRSIKGSAESGSLHSAEGVQFWDGKKAYVALASGDTLERAFYHEIFHVMDSKILSETRVYYHWAALNPKDCEYFSDYTSYLEADVSQYLQDENRVFIDAYSMCYSKEDRARIMEYACMPDNAHYFQSEVMQNKLRTLCEGIRKAFRLETSEESFLWEQYLNEPLKMK